MKYDHALGYTVNKTDSIKVLVLVLKNLFKSQTINQTNNKIA